MKKEIHKLADLLEKQIEKRALSEKDPADAYRHLVLLRFFQDKALFVEQFSKGLEFFTRL